MLDDLALIQRFDSQNALAVAAGAHEQLLYDQYKLKVPQVGKITSVVLTGMGGSALAGLLARNWLEDELKIPFVISRGYELPAFVGPDSVVIASSYSGNTEETLSALAEAETKRAQIFVLSAGGKLAEIARAKNYPLLQIPEGYQPRMTTGFGVKLLAALFSGLGLIKDKSAELNAAHQLLAQSYKGYVAQAPTQDNLAKQIAGHLVGKMVAVYGSPLLSSATYKWKINFNENSKNLAFWNELPEFNHNEFMGWTGKPESKPWGVIHLMSDRDHPQVKKRFTVSPRLLSGKMPQPLEITVQGKSRLEQIMWAVQLGDFASIYLAILNQVNPTPVDLIEKLKKELG